MVRKNPKYTSDMFLTEMSELGKDSAQTVALVDEKAEATKDANKAVDTLRNRAAKAVAIGVLAGMGRKMIIAAAQDLLPQTGGRAARISDALAVLTNAEADDDTVTEIAENWAQGNFKGYEVRPLVMALRAPADIRPRIVGLFLTAWKVQQVDRIEDAVRVGMEAIQHAITVAENATEGTPEKKIDAAVKEAKKWAGTQFKPAEAEQEVEQEQEAVA